MNFLFGILSGLVAAIVIFTVEFIFKKGLMPWYERLIYKGIDLEGDWLFEKDDNGANYQHRLFLDQSAHRLTGVMELSKTGGERDYVQHFVLEGSTWEGYVTLNFRSKSPKRLSFATALLTVNNLGNNLNGYLVYRGRSNDEVKSLEIRWARER